MKTEWIVVLVVCVWSTAEGTFRPSASCVCNGKALYCVRDALGLRCENCQDNTEGRHCENCKEGYHHQRAGERCTPCYCNSIGSVGPGCSSQGQCVCKEGVQGARCDQCTNGAPITSQGCEPLRQSTCFCNGHSDDCSLAPGYAVYNITSAFGQGTEGWRAIAAQGVNPSRVHFRWSPEHHDLEVISRDVLPVYLTAPAQYLGNQVLSYGQPLSFTLRLDRGVRYPSTSDVVLEGAGLKVYASLGDLRTVIPCGKTITYAFRLNEKPGSRWRPQLSQAEFQRLLSDLTGIKIRATFGEDGRGYLDNVTLVSARPGSGSPAGWVQRCRCPAGYEGQFCEQCAAGYRRSNPSRGRQSPCVPCTCRGGSCDPETGDCYPADETNNRLPCSSGYYDSPQQPGTCLRCPCPYDCFVTPGTTSVICICPPGTTGSRCQICEDGFYGDLQGEGRNQQQCRRCQCNGHLDPNAVGNCDRLTGECLKCMNNTKGFYCENCVEGFYHSKPTDACKACNCNPQGSVFSSCSDQGQCNCKEGFEGHKCEKSTCPSCFNSVKSQMEKYALKLRELEALFNKMSTGAGPSTNLTDEALSAAEDMVQSLKTRADTLTATESLLHSKLSSLANTQSRQEGTLQSISKTVENIAKQEQQHKTAVSDIQKLIADIRQNLFKSRQDSKLIDFPLRDAEAGINNMNSLVQKATDLADQHQREAVTIEQTANNALSEANKAMALVSGIVDGENKVKEQINSLNNQYKADVGLVNAMQKQAAGVSSAAQAESNVALDTLKLISDLEKNISTAPENSTADLVARLDSLKDLLASNVTGYQQLQKDILADQKETEALLNKVKTAQQIQDELLARANAAKANADQAVKMFDNLDSVDQALDKIKGFESQLNSNKASADQALSKLPIINSTIQQAAANNDKTRAVLAGLSDFSDALDTIEKLNNTLKRIEKMSDSLPPSADYLTTASALKGSVNGLDTQAVVTMNMLSVEEQNVEQKKRLAEAVNQEANQAYKRATDTRNAVSDTLKTVNDLLGALGKPAAVDENTVSDLERAIANGRSRVETNLRPRLRQLEDTEAQQRANISRMISDIDTILADIQNLEQIKQTIVQLSDTCYNTSPNERP